MTISHKITMAVLAVLGIQSTSAEPFRWGAASAAYQVEGAVYADNKGRSIWDEYLDDHSLAGPGVSGALAINFYDREQYLKDIALFKKLGLTSYRFSISWPRIIPDGTGPANPAAIAHYRQFIQDLKAAGITPLLTLYHWDMPASLAHAGGWQNRNSVDWFKHYADVIFQNFDDQVDSYVLVNEPSVEFAQKTMAEDILEGKEAGMISIVPKAEHLAEALRAFNHILLASAAAKKSFDEQGYKGQLGVAVPLFPMLTDKGASKEDKTAAIQADGVINRWFLDAMYKGQYPTDIIEIAKNNNLKIDVQPDDAMTIYNAKFDYLGINYYAPLYIRKSPNSRGDYAPEMLIPKGKYAAINGEVRPDLFKTLLDRIRINYGNPSVIITENGAGFADEDQLVKNQVHDEKRCDYLVTHIAAMKAAIKAGANVKGYHVWSSHDNLEWLSGYKSRFGLIYVDYNTQKRTIKRSAEIYSKIIRGERITSSDCKSSVG